MKSTIFKMLCSGGFALMLQLPAMAADANSTVQAPVGNGEAGVSGIGILSGGIGQDGQEEMLRVAKTYNVHVLFATRQGAYLADIPFTVTDQKGNQVAAAMSDGPWLYLKLPPGSYQISAQLHGASQSRKVKVGAGGAPISVNFLFPDQ
jgi:hypothetical protein